jgi:hypothetical protein
MVTNARSAAAATNNKSKDEETSTMPTTEQIQNLREAIHGIAADLKITTEEAFVAALMPEWVWGELVAARDAVGPDERSRFDLLAKDTPERQAAADRLYAEIRAAVC